MSIPSITIQGGEDEQQEVCDAVVHDGQEERKESPGLWEGEGGGGSGGRRGGATRGHPARQHGRDRRAIPR